ncbi:MAG: hypothetical protein LBS74_05850 [Oscillospiraceae bacterium]|jgi:rubrerythrin|nr:hypothetical protein [Oscillospiraceae bacterium]
MAKKKELTEPNYVIRTMFHCKPWKKWFTKDPDERWIATKEHNKFCTTRLPRGRIHYLKTLYYGAKVLKKLAGETYMFKVRDFYMEVAKNDPDGEVKEWAIYCLRKRWGIKELAEIANTHTDEEFKLLAIETIPDFPEYQLLLLDIIQYPGQKTAVRMAAFEKLNHPAALYDLTTISADAFYDDLRIRSIDKIGEVYPRKPVKDVDDIYKHINELNYDNGSKWTGELYKVFLAQRHLAMIVLGLQNEEFQKRAIGKIYLFEALKRITFQVVNLNVAKAAVDKLLTFGADGEKELRRLLEDSNFKQSPHAKEIGKHIGHQLEDAQITHLSVLRDRNSTTAERIDAVKGLSKDKKEVRELFQEILEKETEDVSVRREICLRLHGEHKYEDSAENRDVQVCRICGDQKVIRGALVTPGGVVTVDYPNKK